MKKLLAFVLTILLLNQTAAFAQFVFDPETNFQPINPGTNFSPVQPIVTAPPNVPAAPVVTAAPNVPAAPVVTAAPNVTAAPVVTAAPSVPDVPVVTARPNVTDQPEGTLQPVGTALPEEDDGEYVQWNHNHRWSDWEVLEPADGTAMGRRKRACLICGVQTVERFYSEHTLYRDIEDREDDVIKMQKALIDQGYLSGKADGKFGMMTQKAVRDFQRDHGFYQDGIAWEPVQKLLFGENTDDFEPGIGDGGTPDPNIRLEVVTKVVNSPEVNPNFFVPGEVIQLQTTVNNVGSVSLMNVTVETSLPGVSVEPRPWLSFDDSVQFHYNYTVTPEDAAAHRIVLKSQVLYNEHDGIPGSQAAPDVIIPASFHDGIVQITKTPVTSPANGQYYVEGERIAYLIQLDNNTNQALYNVKVQDRLICGSGTLDSILCSGVKVEKNETKYLPFEHYVTSGDVRLGMVSNKASVLAFDIAGLPYSASSATVVVSTSDPEYYGVTYVEPPQPDKAGDWEEIYVDKKTDASGTITLAGGSTTDDTYISVDVYVSSVTPSHAPFEHGGIFTVVEVIEPVETPVPAEPAATVEPTASAVPIVTIEPTVSAEPVVTIEPTLPADPIATVEPTVPAEPAFTVVPTVPAEPVVTVEPTVPAEPIAAVAPSAPEFPAEPQPPVQEEKSSTPSSNKKPSNPLWLTVEGTPVDGMVLRGEYTASKALYQAQRSGEASCEMTLSAGSDAKLGNQIIYIADLENSGVFSSIGTLFNFEADPAQTKVFFGPKNAQESYQVAALMRMNVSDEPFNLTNMTDLTNPAIYKVYQTALSMAAVRLQNVEVAYGDEMLTLVVWDQAHNGQCLVVIARKQ